MGMGAEALTRGIRDRKSAVRRMDGWEKYGGLKSLVGAPSELVGEKAIPRQKRRSMSQLSIQSVQAANEALEEAALEVDALPSDRVGCIVGSTIGSPKTINDFFEIVLPEYTLNNVPAMQFFKAMSHTAAMNVAQYFGLNGYVMATSAACASGLQAIGTGYHLLRLGLQDVMLCGGAEELHPLVTGTFDLLYATSTKYNSSPSDTPRPFDRDRDGLVCGDGAGMVVLETYDHAVKRGADMLVEVSGYASSGSGDHISHSHSSSMANCMRNALDDADISPSDIDYINAHATATLQGDSAEAEAISDVFGPRVPVSSLKGYIGHTLGASGPIELAAVVAMFRDDIIYPGLNLRNVAPDCSGINHVMEPLSGGIERVLKNSFAFGGINSAIVLSRIEGLKE
jgi:3-oxoacyl-[acyl-carrier-protein] synthase II